MEQMTISLREKTTYGPRWYRMTQVVLSIVLIAQGLTYPGKFWGYPLCAIGYGVFVLVVLLLAPRFSKIYAVTLDDRGIRGRISYSNEIDLLWEHVASAEMKMFALILMTKDGHSIPVDFSEWPSEQHKSVRPKLIAFLRSKNPLKEAP